MGMCPGGVFSFVMGRGVFGSGRGNGTVRGGVDALNAASRR
jgi:hypothetical protein